MIMIRKRWRKREIEWRVSTNVENKLMTTRGPTGKGK